jgi:1-phosphatidylinositol-3-phosphate 5-kinase
MRTLWNVSLNLNFKIYLLKFCSAANLNPLYIREHSNRILRGALYNDSKFLADINVMDYSLVCGVSFPQLFAFESSRFECRPIQVDSQNKELVIGIVGRPSLRHHIFLFLTHYEDYIRTYTWDKKLESWVKDKESAFLGGAGKGEPTIVTPRQYRQRFISAMERYFPLVSDMFSEYKLLIEYAF